MIKICRIVGKIRVGAVIAGIGKYWHSIGYHPFLIVLQQNILGLENICLVTQDRERLGVKRNVCDLMIFSLIFV